MHPFHPMHPRRPTYIALVIALVAGIVATGLRLWFVTHAQVLQPVDLEYVRGDAVQYYRYAWNLIHRHTFSVAWSGAAVAAPDSFRDPGYPVVLGIIMAATGSFDPFYATTLLVQAILGGATVALLVIACRRVLSLPWLAAAALLMAIWPHSIAIPAYLLSETLLAFLCSVALCVYGWATTRPRAGRLVVAGVAFGLAALTNAVLIPFGLVLALFAWWRGGLGTRPAAALLIASLALPMAWGARSLTLPDVPSAKGRAMTNLVQGSWPSYHLAYQLASHGDAGAQAEIDAMQEEIDTLQAKPSAGAALMLGRLGERPWTYLRWYLSKPALLWDWSIRIGQGDVYVYPTRESPLKTSSLLAAMAGACYVLNPILMLLALIASVLALVRRGTPPPLQAIACLSLFVTLVYTILQAEPRYSIPFRGPEMLLAMAAVPVGLKAWRQRQKRDGVQES